MKIYKISEEEYKKQKAIHIISGVLCLIVSAITGYQYFMDYSEKASTMVVFGILGITFLKAISNLDRFHFELNGTILTSYLKDKIYYQHDLTKVEVEIVEKRKRSKILIIENDNVKSIFRESDIGETAFDELKNDVNDIIEKM